MEYTTKEFANELNCSVRTLEDWRSKRSMKLLPARYDGRKAIYTSEQIPIARKLLCREGLSNNLFPDLDREETAADAPSAVTDNCPELATEKDNASVEDNCPQLATAEQAAPMSDAEFDSNGDSSGDTECDICPTRQDNSEQNTETVQDICPEREESSETLKRNDAGFQSTFDTPASAEDNHFSELILELPAVESLRAADSDDDSAGKTAPNKAPQRFSEKSAFDPEGFSAITQNAPEKIAHDVHADFVPQDSNEQGEIGGTYFNATGAEKNNAVVDELNHSADVDSEHVDDKSTALIIAQNKLPTRIEDVAKFVLIGRDKLRAVCAEISAINKIEVAAEVREQKLAEGQLIGELVLFAEARLGELLNQIPKTSGGDRRSANFKIPSAGKFENGESESVENPSAENHSGTKKPSKLEVAAELGFGKNQVSQFQKLADNPAAVQKAIADAKTRGEIVTRSRALSMIRKAERKQDIQRQVDEIERQEFEKPDVLFDVIVVDPPWNYGTAYNSDGRRCANPYPEMAQEELKAIKLPAAEDCVLFLWTTHKFIWNAKELLDQWGFDYRCMLVWNKMKMGTGDLFRLQCEFCLVGLKGKPIFKDVHSIRDLIEEPSREHSRKPDAFYRLVDELCTGRKLDYFSRQKREGWTAYGNNTEKFRIDLPNQTGGGDKKIMP